MANVLNQLNSEITLIRLYAKENEKEDSLLHHPIPTHLSVQSTLTLNVRVRFVISKKVRSFGIYRVHRAPHLNGKQNFRPLVTSVPLLSALSSEENNRPLNLRIALTALDKKRELKNS